MMAVILDCETVGQVACHSVALSKCYLPPKKNKVD